ncbi:MAG: hypothetical protein K9L86_04650 [Candidatus Omnitrophica bacterium]|nr:hypothetical protein [Candidatus Omnitrophota bacterium]
MSKKILFILIVLFVNGLIFNGVVFSDKDKKDAASPKIHYDEKTSRERDSDKISTKAVAEDLVVSEPLIYFPKES